MTKPLMEYLERYFGGPQPYRKLDLVAVPEFLAGAMENPGAITYRESILLQSPERATLQQRRGLAGTHAHEFAHLWFGDLVTMRWWDDLWLNESFASWMGDRAVAAVYPEFEESVRQMGSTARAMSADMLASALAVRPKEVNEDNLWQNASTMVYSKGQAILSMAESWMGERVFRDGVGAYLKKHAWGNATADDLWLALEEASKRPVRDVIASFINQPGVPLVTVDVSALGRLRLSQERLFSCGSGDSALSDARWNIPMVIAYATARQVDTLTYILGAKEGIVTLPTAEAIVWINPNVHADGYYLCDVGEGGRDAQMRDGWNAMTPRDRTRFAWTQNALLRAGRITPAEYFRHLTILATDPTPQVLDAALSGLDYAKLAYLTLELSQQFAAYVRETLLPVWRRIGARPQPDEPATVTLQRPTIFRWLGEEGDEPSARALADTLVEAYFAGEEPEPSLTSGALSIHIAGGARLAGGGRPDFDRLVERYLNAKIPSDRSRALGALSQFREPQLQRAALDFCLSGKVRPHEIMNIPWGVAGHSDSSRALALESLYTNYDSIATMIPSEFMSSAPSLVSGCDPFPLARAREFFADKETRFPGTLMELDESAQRINACDCMRRQGQTAALEFFRAIAPSQ